MPQEARETACGPPCFVRPDIARPDIAGPVPMPLHEQAPGERDGCPAPSGCARPAVKRVRIVRPSSLIEPGNWLVMPLRRTVVEPTPLAFGAVIFVRYASDFCLLAAAARKRGKCANNGPEHAQQAA
jgi:hypothetical protein